MAVVVVEKLLNSPRQPKQKKKTPKQKLIQVPHPNVGLFTGAPLSIQSSTKKKKKRRGGQHSKKKKRTVLLHAKEEARRKAQKKKKCGNKKVQSPVRKDTYTHTIDGYTSRFTVHERFELFNKDRAAKLPLSLLGIIENETEYIENVSSLFFFHGGKVTSANMRQIKIVFFSHVATPSASM